MAAVPKYADEFWIPASGNLRTSRDLKDADLLRVDRFNVPMRQGSETANPPIRPKDFAQLPMVVRAIPDFRHHMQRIQRHLGSWGFPSPKSWCVLNSSNRFCRPGITPMRSMEGTSGVPRRRIFSSRTFLLRH